MGTAARLGSWTQPRPGLGLPPVSGHKQGSGQGFSAHSPATGGSMEAPRHSGKDQQPSCSPASLSFPETQWVQGLGHMREVHSGLGWAARTPHIG